MGEQPNIDVVVRVSQARVWVGDGLVRFARGSVPGDVCVSVRLGDQCAGTNLTMLEAVELVDAIGELAR